MDKHLLTILIQYPWILGNMASILLYSEMSVE